ncbi:tetratricopeptide repeat protein [Streptomyces sp. NBC_01477]|uniref:tetratricopeptide repeat protein n=1 Tax=Streptomyces sp. NBC_01477 TaxID=2976015 RepID=UPI002E36B00E|nr:tetratricopeptide repeat protein [Streptomyces sp. NBC_01477]
MDLTDVLAVVGMVSTAAGVGITWWRARAGDRAEFRRRRAAPGVAPGMSVAPPVGALPTQIRGRGRLMRRLRRWLRKPPGVVVVLAGMGGVGKSTTAAALARDSARTRRTGRRSRPVWWVRAADSLSLAGGLASVARQLGAEPADLEAISTGAADGPDRFWELLGNAPSGWLLIFDNADSPAILYGARCDAERSGAQPAGAVGQNGTGWVRPSRRGLTIVTSRDADQETWGSHARLVPLGPLDETDAARALLDLAPEAGDEAEARLLARRLGGLPLALHLAGSYLRSAVVYCPTFTAYAEVLGGDGGLRLLDGSGAPDRSVVTRTWEISLDNLARDGVPQARNLLRLLSCYAADASIPMGLLDGRRLSSLLATGPAGSPLDHSDLLLERGLRGLERVGLIDVGTSGQERALTLHPLIVQTNRMNLGTTTSRDTEPDATLVRQVAAGLVVEALSGLRVDEPADWPRYRMFGVHLHALLGTVADHLDADGLTALLRAIWMTVRALDESGAHDVAERLNRAALAHVPGPDDEAGLCLSHQHAWEVAARGEFGDSERMFLDVAERRARTLGNDHPETLSSRHELAWVAGCQERWVEAEARYDLVLEDRRRVLGEDHFDTLLTRFERGWCIANQERFEEARALLENVLEDRTRVLGEAHQRTVGTRHELAWIAAKQGRLVEAERLYRQVLDDRRRALGDEHLSTLTIHHELAWVLACRGRSKEAATRYARVLDIRRRRLGEDHPDTRATALALDRLGRGLTVDARHLV